MLRGKYTRLFTGITINIVSVMNDFVNVVKNMFMLCQSIFWYEMWRYVFMNVSMDIHDIYVFLKVSFQSEMCLTKRAFKV